MSRSSSLFFPFLCIRRSLWTLLAVLVSPLVSHVDAFQGYRHRDILEDYQKQANESDLLWYKNNPTTTDDVQELYLTQRLDHFDPTNLQTYQQRYFVTDRYQVEDADTTITFLCVGGEGPGFDTSVLIDSVHCTGDMLELAHRLSHSYQISVHVYALEHRYYGKSYPDFGDESPVTTQNLKYLSSKQALEDLAHFVHVMNTQEEASQQIKWVTFGGSYPGYMAGNARLKYPHLIFSAVSSSAPLQLEVDFPGYKRRQGWDLKYEKVGGSSRCWEIVKQGHVQAVALVQENPKGLAEMFHVCEPETALLDKSNQNLLLGDGLVDIPAQGNDPSCQGELCNIERLCDYMTTYSKNATELEILADVARKQHGGSDDDCMSVDWKAYLQQLAKPIVADFGWRSWLWQTCTEVGFYQTCDETCPFASFYHLVDMDLEICKVAFNITNVYDNVQATLDHYGGLDINDGSRVLSINGNVDPWSVLGLQSSPKYSLPVEMVEGASHHFWTHVVQETDAPEIVQVRDYIYSVVMDWLGIDIDSSDDADKLSSSSALRGRE